MLVNNILQFIHGLFSCNFAELLVVFIPMILVWPLPLGVLEILWLKMLTDVLRAMALALDASEPEVMHSMLILTRTDIETLATRFRPSTPVWSIGAYLVPVADGWGWGDA